jgi:hypothetical protein
MWALWREIHPHSDRLRLLPHQGFNFIMHPNSKRAPFLHSIHPRQLLCSICQAQLFSSFSRLRPVASLRWSEARQTHMHGYNPTFSQIQSPAKFPPSKPLDLCSMLSTSLERDIYMNFLFLYQLCIGARRSNETRSLCNSSFYYYRAKRERRKINKDEKLKQPFTSATIFLW